MTKNLFLVSFAALLLLSFAGCGDLEDGDATPAEGDTQTEETKEVKTYKVGVILPLTGDSAGMGETLQRVIDFRSGEINANSGKVGYKLELAYEDGQCDKEVVDTAFQKLSDEGVKYFVGLLCSTESLELASSFEEKEAVGIFATTFNSEVEGESSNLYTFSYNEEAIGEGAEVVNSEYLSYKAKIEASKGSIESAAGFYPPVILDVMNILGDQIAKHDGGMEKIVSELSTGTFDGWTGRSLTFGGKSFVQGIEVSKVVEDEEKEEPEEVE